MRVDQLSAAAHESTRLLLLHYVPDPQVTGTAGDGDDATIRHVVRHGAGGGSKAMRRMVLALLLGSGRGCEGGTVLRGDADDVVEAAEPGDGQARTTGKARTATTRPMPRTATPTSVHPRPRIASCSTASAATTSCSIRCA